MKWASWHNHTGDGPRFSYCAAKNLSPQFYIDAIANGPWTAFAITDHIFAMMIPEDSNPWPNQWFLNQHELHRHKAFYEDRIATYLARLQTFCDGKTIFGGMEIEVDGNLEPIFDLSLRDKLDVLIGSIHHLPGDSVDEKIRWHFDQVDALLQMPIDIVAHPFRNLAQFTYINDEIMDETLNRIAAAGIAVEVNAHVPFNREPDMLRKAVSRGMTVAFSIDMHDRSEITAYNYLDEVVKKSGVKEEDIKLFQPTVRINS
ncbi:MAG: hypothetical protein WCO98_03740 [bacterium]